MVAIRDLNTAGVYPFRYPRWVEGVFYPAGSIIGYPKSGGDSDMVYYDFYVATRNVLASETAIPGLNPKWELFVSTSGGSPDSDLKLKVYMLDSDVQALQLLTDDLRLEFDSDITNLSNSSVKTVNGVSPDAQGNVEVSLVSVNAGTNDQRNLHSAVEGDFWVVAGDSDTTNDGKSYIFDSDSMSWLRVNTADVEANDVRYINASGDVMIGALALSGDPLLPLEAATKGYVDDKDSDLSVAISAAVAAIPDPQADSDWIDRFVSEKIELLVDSEFVLSVVADSDTIVGMIVSEKNARQDADSDIIAMIQLADSDGLVALVEAEAITRANEDSDIRALISSTSGGLGTIVHDYQAADSDIIAMIPNGIDSDISVNTIRFGDNPQGVLSWNPDETTLDLTLNADVTLQLGQEQVFYGKATEAISNGDVVMFAGAQGNHLLFAKADMQAPGFEDSHLIGIATQDFSNNDYGFVTVQGKVRGLNTSAYSEGDILYVDPSNPGGLTVTKPVAPDHNVEIASVLRSHNVDGTIFVRVGKGMHLSDLHDVSNHQNHGYFIVWDSDNELWQTKELQTDSDWILRQISSTTVNVESDSDWILNQISNAGSQIDGGGAATVYSANNPVINGGGA